MVFLTREGQNPNTVIVDRMSRKLLGKFQNGRFETEDAKLIARLKPHYEVEDRGHSGTRKGKGR